MGQTYQLPGRADEYVSRLQQAVDAQPAARAAYPDIAALIRRRTALLGRYLGQVKLSFDGLAPRLDLGAAFRVRPTSAVPALVFCGTLDGRTDLKDPRAAVAGLTNARVITVQNAGHNLLDAPSPQLLAAIHRFMTGMALSHATLTVPLPALAP